MDAVRGPFHACCAAIGVAAAAASAHADLLWPGQTIPLSGTTVAERPELGGPYVAWATVSFAGPAGEYSGSVEVGLIDIGVLIQTYRIATFQDFGFGFEIEGLATEPQWGPGPVDVDYRSDSLGTVSPTAASWLLGGAGVTFDFQTHMLSGESSQEMFLVTETDLFDGPLGYWGAQVILRDPMGSLTAASIQSFGTYIPAPGAGLMLALAGLIVPRRRRRRRVRWPRESV